MKNRTNADFSKHQHRVELYKNGEKEIRVDHLQIGDSNCFYIQFINTDRTLTVTGDFGNWVFCRPFFPSVDGYVNDMYWTEKLRTYSTQIASSYDSKETEKEIIELVDRGLEQYGYEDEQLKKAKEWFTGLLDYVDDEINYQYHAFRDCFMPDFIDYEEIPFIKKGDHRLSIIFDAFDEICRRLKENTNSIPAKVEEIEKPYMAFDGEDGLINDFATEAQAKECLLEYATDHSDGTYHPTFCDGGSFIAKKITVSGFEVHDCVDNYDTPEEWEEETGYNADEIDKIGKSIWIPVKEK